MLVYNNDISILIYDLRIIVLFNDYGYIILNCQLEIHDDKPPTILPFLAIRRMAIRRWIHIRFSYADVCSAKSQTIKSIDVMLRETNDKERKLDYQETTRRCPTHSSGFILLTFLSREITLWIVMLPAKSRFLRVSV